MSEEWYKNTVFYQIYPRSFCDSNGDGIGDIQGIISKLDYLKELGIGAIWLSPVYKSPNVDFGYDISDYRDINPEYGTLDDMKQLFAEAESRGIKIVMDLVVNHTSSQHEWFKAAQDPESPYHDYYIWKEPKRNKRGRLRPPNNWQSFFSGSAWQLMKNGKYYLHLFDKRQPDLNYRNPKVIEEVKDILRFWLDMGAAGFRCDVINVIYKDSFEDGSSNSLYITGSEHYLATEGSRKILQELQKEVLEPRGAFTVGETTGVTIESAQMLIREGCLDTVFSFDHTAADEWRMPLFKVKYQPKRMKAALMKWQQAIDWNALFFENHDQPRSISRFGAIGPRRDESAKMLATVLLTLRGSPFIYQGEEIAMTNYPFKTIDEVKDISARTVYTRLRGYGVLPIIARRLALNICRDHVRTPMQWSSGRNAGFSSAEETWLPVNPSYTVINVALQETDESSIQSYYTKLIHVRNETEALQTGAIEFIDSHHEVLAYYRVGAEETSERVCVIVNLSKSPRPTPSCDTNGEVLASNYDMPPGRVLRPYEAVVIKCAPRE